MNKTEHCNQIRKGTPFPHATETIIIYDGLAGTASEWAEEMGLAKTSLFERIRALGLEEAMSKPVKSQFKEKKVATKRAKGVMDSFLYPAHKGKCHD